MSLAYHLQTDNQKENVNKCLETYLHWFLSKNISHDPTHGWGGIQVNTSTIFSIHPMFQILSLNKIIKTTTQSLIAQPKLDESSIF